MNGTAVRFIVVAEGEDEAEIAAVAQEAAAENPIGRRVVTREDEDFPAAEQIDLWTEDTPEPGAVVLRPDGTLFEVLNIDDAKNAAVVSASFAFAHD
jgi:hypothetical protein